MKKLLFALFLSLGFCQLPQAQEGGCNCSADLEFLHRKVRKTPSYKQNKEDYQKAYTRALAQARTQMDHYDCFLLINQVLLSLNDWHMGVFEPSAEQANQGKVSFPRYPGDLTKLVKRLKQIPEDEAEGIYHRKGMVSIALEYVAEEQRYQAVVIDSESENWTEGDILFNLYPKGENSFSLATGYFPAKRAISNYAKVREGVFLRWGYVKDTTAQYFHRKVYPEQQYVYEDLSPEIDYVKVGSFKSFYPTLSEAEAFYRRIKGTLNKPHLILDLRGNTGGGNRNSDILLEQLKNYLKQGQLHVLLNSWTGSNAEQYAVKLKKLKNVTTYGLPTLGALAYEKKGKVNHSLPSSGFIVTLPTKIHKEFLSYETKGVEPDHLLSLHEDWVEQVRNHIGIKK